MKGIKVKITEETHSKAKLLAGCGLRDEEIAQVLGMSEATLKRKCAQALVSGRCVALATVAQTLYRMATSGKHIAATIFYLKVRGHWHEHVTVSGPNEGPIEVSDVRARLASRIATLAAQRETKQISGATEAG